MLIMFGLLIVFLSIWYISTAAQCNPCAITFIPNSTFAPTAEYLEQVPALLPEFIAYLDRTPSGGGSNRSRVLEICIWIHHEPFSQPGMSDDEVNEQISKHQTLMVDGIIVPVTARLWHLHEWCDGKPSDTQTCGGATSMTCINIERAEEGLHLAEIKLINAANQSFSYEWVFRTEKDMYKHYVTPMYLPSTPHF